MQETSPRQRAFMTAVLHASERQNSVIDVSGVCLGLRMDADECQAVVRWAGKAGLLTDLGGGQAILTGAGRDFAERRFRMQE